jgi:hypothetical protein
LPSQNSTAEQESLAPLEPKRIQLVELLDAMGGDDHAKSVTESGERLHDGSAFIFRRHAPDEASVAFDRIGFGVSQFI